MLIYHQPTNFQASANAGANDVDLSWDDIGATGYLVVANVGDSVSFVPENGMSYSLPADATQGADEIHLRRECSKHKPLRLCCR